MKLLLALLSAACGAAEPDIQAMKAGTVKILVRSHVQGPNGQTGYVDSHGSGFLVNDTHVVTNNHVCCATVKQRMPVTSVELKVHISVNSFTTAKALWSSAAKDLGVLQLTGSLGKSNIAVVAPAIIRDGIAVWAVGFPGAAESPNATQESNFKSVVTTGIIGKFAQKMLVAGPTIEVIDHSAPVNSGNSGGPLFNACGEVVGTNHAKAASAEVEGIYWAIHNKELLPELDKLGVKYTVTDKPCDASGGADSAVSSKLSTLVITQVGSIALGLAALGLAMNKRVRQSVSRRFTTRRSEPDRRALHSEPPVYNAPRPYLKGIAGYYSGSSVQLEDEPWVIGRDRAAANLVLPPDQGSVSKRHCIIRFDGEANRVFLEDAWSSNGTFLSSGVKIDPGRPYELRPGDRFYLADKSCMFEISMEG